MDTVHVRRTTMRRRTRSSTWGKRTLPWLNTDVAFSVTSNTSTASGGAPSAATAASLITIEMSARMEAHSGGNVGFQIGVMHSMQAPQRRHRMECDVLSIDRQMTNSASRKVKPGLKVV